MALLVPTKSDGNLAARDIEGRAGSDTSTFLAATLDNIDLRNIWRTVWRWRGLVMWTTLALTALAIFIIFHLTPLYTGSAQVLVGVDKVKVGSLQEVLSDLKGDNEMIATEIGVIRSRNLAEKTVTKLNLDNNPEFNPALRGPGLLARLVSAQHFLPASWTNWLTSSSSGASGDESHDMSKIVDTFEDKLKVANDGHSRIITISFESENPVTAAQVANTLADAYIVARLDQKFEATKRANVWLAERLNSLRQEVQVSEDAVEKFRNENGLLRTQTPSAPGTQGTTLTTQQMAQVSAEAITAHTKYLEAQSRLAQIQRSGITRGKGANVDAAIQDDNLLEVLQSPVIQGLRAQEADAQRRAADLAAQYGDKHPRIIAVRAEIAEIRSKIQTEVARIIDALRNDVATQQAREQALNTMLAKMKAEASRNDIAEVQLRDLERQAQANRTLYENFLTQFKQTQSQDSFQQPDADIISHAPVPTKPSFPQKAVLIILSALTSFVVGVLLALACQNLDVAIRSMDQVRSTLKVHALGMVPALAGLRRATGRPEQEVLDRPLSAYAESIRSIHTNLMLSDVDQRPRVVLVTSALPGEGKSTLAMSLAQTVARYGQRVVIIDGDLRRPALHRLAGVASKPGLVDWLVNRNPLEHVIYTAGPGGVDVIPAGDQPQMPPNLLSSDRFKQLLRGLMERYDMVILDSAPVLAVTDTKILATLAEKTIFVVRWASTSQKVAAAALRQLFEAGAHVAGAALIAVDVKAHAKDGFTDSVLYSGRLREYYR